MKNKDASFQEEYYNKKSRKDFNKELKKHKNSGSKFSFQDWRIKEKERKAFNELKKVMINKY